MFMRDIRKISILIVSLIITMSFTACGSGELSRGKAERMINDYLKENLVKKEVNLGRVSILKDDVPKYRALSEKGLIQMKFIEKTYFNSEVYEISLTNNASPHILKYSGNEVTVKLADKVEPKVTGITKSANDAGGRVVCSAIYLYKLKPTPFGEAFISQNDLTSYHKDEMHFVLFDDGWRRTKQ